MDRRALLALLLFTGMLSLTALACTSDQEWIIPRTATPTPTNTLIPMESVAEFAAGDTVEIVAVGAFSIPQTNQPEPDQRNNRVMGGGCFPGQKAPVLDVAQGPDGKVYYKVTCILDGWVPADNVKAAE